MHNQIIFLFDIAFALIDCSCHICKQEIEQSVMTQKIFKYKGNKVWCFFMLFLGSKKQLSYLCIMMQNNTNVCPNRLEWTSIVYNDHLDIEEVFNGESRILLQFPIDVLRGMNVRDLEDNVIESNKHWARVIADNIKKAKYQKRHVYFEFISDLGDGDIAFVVSHVEYLPDGHIQQYFMEVCEEDVISIRREAVKVSINSEYIEKRLEDVLLWEKYEKLYNQNNTVLESLPVGVELYAIDGTLLYLNLRDSQIFGVDREMILASRLNIYSNPNLPEEVKNAVREKRKVHASFPYYFTKVQEDHYYYTEKVEDIRRIECNGMPVINSKGEAESYVFIVNDITDLHRQSRILDETRRNLALAMEAGNITAWIYDIDSEEFLYLEGDAISKRCVSMNDILKRIHPEDINIFKKKFQKIVDGLVTKQNLHLRIRDEERKGEYRYFEYIIVPIPNGSDKALYLTGIEKDVTTEFNRQVELSKLNRQNELVLNNINSALVYVSTNFVVQWENISSKFLSPDADFYKKGELCYKSAKNRTEPCETCALQRAWKSGQTEQATYTLSDGRTGEITAVPVKHNGNLEGGVLRIDDVTERNRMIKELQVAKQNAEQSDKLKSAFLANMSHEIRTPLNAIIGFSDLLTTTVNQKEKEEYINIIKTNNELLLKLINDILDLSKIEAGAVDMHFDEFDFSTFFDEIVTSIQPRIKQGIKFITKNPYSTCIIKSDRNRLMQILINFVTNAVKYTTTGFIEMGYEYTAPNLQLYVVDSGIGIPENKKHRVFHRFEKLDEFAQGTGLGLSICKAIVETFGGSIGFDTEEGKGSKFWALIPCEFEGITDKNRIYEEDY